MSYFAALSQEVTLPAALQSTANINAGATFTSGWSSTLNVAGIQVNIFATQNCTIFVDQSSDGVNTDLTDTYNYIATFGGSPQGNSWTTQATAAFVQVRVKNVGPIATTTLRMQTALCPIVDAVPRALSDRGNLKVACYEMESPGFDKTAIITPMQALKVTEANRLAGASFSEAGPNVEPAYWATTPVGTGTAVVGTGQVVLSTGITSASSILVASQRIARYIGSSSNTFRGVVRAPAVTGVNTRRWGAFDVNNGFFFEQDSALGFSIVARKATSDANKVTTGAFNGELGTTYTLDANAHTFEVFWTNSTAWFFIDDFLLHKLTGATAPLTSTLHLKVGLSNTNGANINNNTLEVRTATISRLGEAETQPLFVDINTSTTTLLKSGPGNLHDIVFNTAPTGTDWTVTVYDNIIAGGTIIGVFTLRNPTTARTPISLDMHGLPFSVGLTVLTAGGTPGDMTVVYE